MEDPIQHVIQTNGLLDQQIAGTDRTDKEIFAIDKKIGMQRSEFISAASPIGPQQWNTALAAEVSNISAEENLNLPDSDGSKHKRGKNGN